jgi:hypothetical protein
VSVSSVLEAVAVAAASNGSNSDSFLFSVWSVEDEEGSITVGEAVSTEIGPDLFDVGLEDGTDDVIAVAIAVSPIDNEAICEGLADDAWPEGAMEEGANDAGMFVGGCCFFFIQSL